MATKKALVEKDWIQLFDNIEPLDKPLSKLSNLERRRIMGLSEEEKAYMRAYRKTEKYKASKRAYQKTEKAKAYNRAYRKTKKYKAYQKAYYQRKKQRGKTVENDN